MLSLIKYPLFYCEEVGKIFKHSKKIFTWKFKFNKDINIELHDSKISGKRRVILNEKEVYCIIQNALFTYTFIYSGLNFSIVQLTRTQYELYINHEPFSRILEQSRKHINEGNIVAKEAEQDDIYGMKRLVEIENHIHHEDIWDFNLDFTNNNKIDSENEISSITYHKNLQKKLLFDENSNLSL